MQIRRRHSHGAWLGAALLSAGGPLLAQDPGPPPAVALAPQPLPAGVPLSGLTLPEAPAIQQAGFFSTKQAPAATAAPPLASPPPSGTELLPRLNADPTGKPPAPPVPQTSAPPTYPSRTVSPVAPVAPAWRWYGWGATNPHLMATLPALAGDPLAGPATAAPPAIDPPAITTADEPKPSLPAWSPAAAAPPATDLRLTAPDKPMPAPPVTTTPVDPRTGASAPVPEPWKTARASSNR